jgi:hypothetical protein
MLEKPVVGVGETLTQSNRVAPAERVQAADIESLPRCSVGPRSVESDPGVRIHDFADEISEVRDR